MKAWRVHQYGKPGEILQLDEVPTPEPRPQQLRIRVESPALNDNDLDYASHQDVARYITVSLLRF